MSAGIIVLAGLPWDGMFIPALTRWAIFYRSCGAEMMAPLADWFFECRPEVGITIMAGDG